MYLLPGDLTPECAKPPGSAASPLGPSPAQCGVSAGRPMFVIARSWKEPLSCCMCCGCSKEHSDLAAWNGCIWWQKLGFDDSGGPLKSYVSKCACQGKQTTMNILFNPPAKSNRCRLAKLQVSMWESTLMQYCLCGFFFWFFCAILCKKYFKKWITGFSLQRQV